MLKTNLLPEKEKKIIKLERTRRALIFFAAVASLIFLLGSLLLLPSYLPAFLERKELERSLEWEKKVSSELGITDLITQVMTIKKTVDSIHAFVSNPPRTSALFSQFFANSGPEIDITNLDISHKGDILIQGKAKTRKGLLEFEQKLREDGLFQNISSPLSNIIQETNINFTIQGNLEEKL